MVPTFVYPSLSDTRYDTRKFSARKMSSFPLIYPKAIHEIGEENSWWSYLSDNGASTYQCPSHNGRNSASEDRRNSIHCVGRTDGEARVIRAAMKAISFRVHVAVIGFLSFTGTAAVEVNVRVSAVCGAYLAASDWSPRRPIRGNDGFPK